MPDPRPQTDAAPAVAGRSPEQAAGEDAFLEIHDVLANVDAAIGRAERALKALSRKNNPHPFLVPAMERALAELDDVRRRLMQGTYWAMEEAAEYDPGQAPLPLAEQVALFDMGPDADGLV